MLYYPIKQLVRAFSVVLIALFPVAVFATPGDILFSDTFTRANLAPWTTTNAGRSGIQVSGPLSGSAPSAGYTRFGAVTVTSPTFNAAVPAARLDIWVRRGSDAFLPISEDTDSGEDFVVEYQTAGGAWNQVVTYLGSGTNGQIYQASFVLPVAALHGALALRVRQTNGSGSNFDYWHFDDVIVTEIAVPGPLVVGACDDFETGLGTNWTINPTSGLAGISSATASSPTNSLFLNGGVVNVTSLAIDTSDITFGDVTLWVRRGSDAFSENPDFGENLVVEYFNDSGSWVALETFTGAGTQGQIFNRTYTIPAAGRHAGFRLRFRMTGGSGSIWDFWHVDDVCLTQNPNPILQVTKLSSVVFDPSNEGKAIPGAFVQYVVLVANQGIGTVDANSIDISDVVPANTSLYVDTTSGDPITLVQGIPPSGLGYSFAADVTFSEAVGGGAPYTYNPTADGQGVDPRVTGFLVQPTGTMNGDTGSGPPSFSIVFRVLIE